MESLDLGTAQIEPRHAVPAGACTTITYTYTAGHPIDDSGYVLIAFRQVSDFGTPQFNDPAAPNYCSIRTTGNCHVVPRWDPKGFTRPWGRCIYLNVRQGYLDRGEQIIVTFGDTSGGSIGWRMQTFCERTFEFKTLVDPIATFEFKELPESPTLEVVPNVPFKAVCIAPSQVIQGEPFHYWLQLEDVWGNPVGEPQALSHSGLADLGVQRIEAHDQATGLSAESNPIRVVLPGPTLRPRWADFHAQSEETVGTNSIEDYFQFARDRAFLDIAAHQGNDFQVTDEFWQEINDVSQQAQRPGSFVTFPGYEWSGNTPLGGDRNIYFEHEGGTIVHSCLDLLPGKTSRYPTAYTADELFAALKRQTSPRAFGFAHVGGRYADECIHDPDIEIAVEVHSSWGTFEWLVNDALQKGYRVGICANSDGHKGRPGAEYPGAGLFGSYGGLTCVLPPRLERPDIVRALRARHFYATTGHRTLIDLEVLTADGRSAMMGDVLPAGEGTASLRLRVAGTGAIESVQVRNGVQVLHELQPYAAADLGNRIKIVWSGAEVRGRDRMVTWDGSLAISGNAIAAIQPVNFWNPARPLELVDEQHVQWRSVTTGGPAGMILTLREANTGAIDIQTTQGIIKVNDIGSLGLEPLIWDFGGVDKQIRISRLPGLPAPRDWTFQVPLALHGGDNPIYVRVMQEDGHMAWTSPVYLVR